MEEVLYKRVSALEYKTWINSRVFENFTVQEKHYIGMKYRMCEDRTNYSIYIYKDLLVYKYIDEWYTMEYSSSIFICDGLDGLVQAIDVYRCWLGNEI